MKRAILQDILKRCHAQLQRGSHPQKNNFIHWTFLVRDNRIISSGVNRPVEPPKCFGYHNAMNSQERHSSPNKNYHTLGHKSPLCSCSIEAEMGNHAEKLNLGKATGTKKIFFQNPSCPKHQNFTVDNPSGKRRDRKLGDESAFPANITVLIPKLHSELDSIRRCREYVGGCTAVNVRLNKTGQIRLSAPCLICSKLLFAMKIKKVFFTTNSGWAEQCIN